MSKEIKNENNLINDSVYSRSLSRLLELYSGYSNNLKNEIEFLKKDTNGGLTISLFIFLFFTPMFLLSLLLDTNDSFITALLSAGVIIPNIPFSIIIKRKFRQTLNITNSQLITIMSIENYLKSELEISKEYKNLLSKGQILEKENIHKQQLDSILNNTVSLSVLNEEYLKEYRKNLMVLDSLEDLDDKQKENYLKSIYSQISTNLITKTNINFNDNEELSSTGSNQSEMLITNGNNNSFNETLQMQDKDLQPYKKPISLKKEDYSNYYNYYNTNNDDTNNLVIDDTTKAQKELEKGHQFSKKYPN